MLGLTNVDLDTAIAQQDTADVISSSWAECENDIGSGVVLAESTPLEQMALQGQSFLGNADEFTPYGEYCTANASTPGSSCVFSAGDTPPGWFGIGGTSLSSPLWSGIVADRDSFQGFRSGLVNPLLYLLYNLAPKVYFHDIDGTQPVNNNGLFPALPGFDLSTGIGTPKMAALITGTF